MKPADLKSSIYIDSSKKNNKTVSKFKVPKLVVVLEHQNIKIYLQKVVLEIGLKKFLWLKKLKIPCPGLMLLIISMEKKLLEQFMKKKLQKDFKKDDEWYVK